MQVQQRDAVADIRHAERIMADLIADHEVLSGALMRVGDPTATVVRLSLHALVQGQSALSTGRRSLATSMTGARRRRGRRVGAAALLGLSSILLGCGPTFDDAEAHNALAEDESSSTDPDDEPWWPPGPNTSTSGSAGGSESGATSFDPEDPEGDNPPPETDGYVDAPPVIQEEKVNGSGFPDPVTLAGPVTLSVVAHDDDAIEHVTFWVDGQPVATVTEPLDGWVYSHTLAVQHQDDGGDHSFFAVAKDSAGQKTTSNSVAWTVELPESGTTVVSAEPTPNHGKHIFWSDVAFSGNGNILIAGHYVKDGTTYMSVEWRAPDGELIDPSWIMPIKDRVAVGVVYDGVEPIIVARNIDGSSWIGRYTYTGDLEAEYEQDAVEWRDVAVAGDLVYVAGNTGSLIQGDTSARTWALTRFDLVPYWIRNEDEGGSSNVASALTVEQVEDDLVVFVTGHVSLADDERRGAVWAYAASDGEERWSKVFGLENEDLHDIAVRGDQVRVVGVAPGGFGTTMRLRRLNTNGLESSVQPLDAESTYDAAYTIANSSDSLVLAGAACSPTECFGQARRYEGTNEVWVQDIGLLSPTSRVVASESLDFGYVALLGQHEVNYGQGDHGMSWLRVIHP